MLRGQRRKVRTLIIAPTRELAEQIHIEISRLGSKTGFSSLAVYGGVSKAGQAKKLRKGVDIVVACPGRLLDHLKDRTFNLSKVEHLVLDEADHMLDMGFLPDIRRILKLLPVKRQTLLFSATMPSEIRHLAEDVLDNPVRIKIGHSRPTSTVSHSLYSVNQNKKMSLLKNIMSNTQMTSTLIFTRTKYRAKSISSQLQKAGYAATSLQGNLSQQKRQKALNGFRHGEFKVLVATDIAARGIDVTGISHVINFDVPATVDAYTHRIGRTGRADSTGAAYTFASSEDRKIISQIEKALGEKLVRINSPETSEVAAGNRAPAKRSAKKSWNKAIKNSQPSNRKTGRTNSTPVTGKEKQDIDRRHRSVSKRNRRAALIIDRAGNLFLNP
jgi:superfamily II DNA/RNA helicase